MPTIWDPKTRQELHDRFGRLTPATHATWGKMSAIQMLRHCTIAVDMMLGVAKVAPKSGPFRFAPLRYLIIHVLPWPKGVPTAPELITTSYGGNWDNDVRALRRSIDAMAARGSGGQFAEHPAFGKLSGSDLGVLTHKHLDHHLRQFGIAK